MENIKKLEGLPHLNTKEVVVSFSIKETIPDPESSGSWFQRLLRRLRRLPEPTVDIPISREVTITCGYEDKGDEARLWMTPDEAESLKEYGFPIRGILLDWEIFKGRGMIIHLPKSVLTVN